MGDVVSVGDQVQLRAFPLCCGTQRFDGGGVDRSGAPVVAVGFALEHRVIELGEAGVGALGQFQGGAQRRSVDVVGDADGPQHVVGGCGDSGVQEGSTHRDGTTPEPDVHSRSVLGGNVDGDVGGSGLDVPWLYVSS